MTICRTCYHILNVGIMIGIVAHNNNDVMIQRLFGNHSVSLVDDIIISLLWGVVTIVHVFLHVFYFQQLLHILLSLTSLLC